MRPGLRPVRADVDLAAVAHNVGVMSRLAAPARLCAVVKAGAYGHGAVPVARAALGAGASCLAVATIEEGAELRDGGIAAPVLLLSEPLPELMAEVVALGLTPTLYTPDGLEAAAVAAKAGRPEPGPGSRPYPVHLKVDTGMHRVGASPDEALALASRVQASDQLELAGLWTHFAVADDAGNGFTSGQEAQLDALLRRLAEAGVRPGSVHSCNSAAVLTGHACRDMVRCGITIYGVAPAAALEGAADLRPALSLRARVSYLRRVGAGEGISYGLQYRPAEATTVATVPLGYADGLPWRLGPTGGEVLIGGRRLPIAGSVTMDQILVDCGPQASVRPGDEVVLLGRQGKEEITAWEWATRTGTIAYEVLCGIGARVPRVYQ